MGGNWCNKIGFIAAIFAIGLAIFFVENGKPTDLSKLGVLKNIRSYLIDNTLLAVEKCVRVLPRSSVEFVETAFQQYLSSTHSASDPRVNTGQTLHLAVVSCGDRLEETLVNIKSSLLFTTSKIVFHIFAEEELQPGFREGIKSWPYLYRRNLEFRLYPITYPSDGNEANWKKLFKPCASQRLFLPLVLDKSIDSVLYVDTDILFLSDVTKFWNLFNEFNSTQLSSLCIEHEDTKMGWYNRFGRHPYYGSTGLNSGVMLMNLTRMREAEYKNDLTEQKMTWENMLLPLYNKYRLNITWGDQDLLNIVFHHNPEMLNVFTCEYNYRPDHCMYGQLCKHAVEKGVKIVHGNRGVYHNEKQPAFKAVYQAIKLYNFKKDLTDQLLKPMKLGLSQTKSTYCGRESECILQGLQQSIKKIEVEDKS